jgi:uncharacterized membrane protein
MSSSTRPPEAGAPATDLRGRVLWPARVLLVLAYLALAHLASVGGNPGIAALALLAAVVLVLLPVLLQPRILAWAALAAIGAALWWLSATPGVWIVLRQGPVACVAFVCLGFARTLGRGRVPLVTRIAAAMDQLSPEALAPELRDYTRRVTAGWAWMLGALAVFDLALVLRGTPEQWSWFANIGDYVAIGGFMLLEFAWRQHRFPGRHRSFPDFLRRMFALGPEFWRTVAAR